MELLGDLLGRFCSATVGVQVGTDAAVIASFSRNISAPADDADGPESDSGSEHAASLS